MPLRTAALPLLAALAMTAPALAQTSLVEIDDSVTVPMLNVTADAAEDMDVTGPSGSKIGEVDEVVGTDASTPAALVIDFEDGSTYGDRDVAIPLDQFTMSGTTLTLNATPEAVAKFDAHKD